MSNEDRLQAIIDKWKEIESRLDLVIDQQGTIHYENISAIKSDIDRMVDQLTKIKINLHLIDSKINYSKENTKEALDLMEQISLNNKPDLIRYLLIFAVNDERNLRQAISELSMAEKRKLELALKGK